MPFLQKFLRRPLSQLLLTPTNIFFFPCKESPCVFKSLREALEIVDKTSEAVEIYLDGGEQTIFTEPLPDLKKMEKQSYLKHRISLLLEKADFVFIRSLKKTITIVTEKYTLSSDLEKRSYRIKSIRSLPLQLALFCEQPTLIRLSLPDGNERLFYGKKKSLYFTRTILKNDSGAYDKTLRYIERTFHQSPETLSIKTWVYKDLVHALTSPENPSCYLKSRRSRIIPVAYYSHCGLRILSILLTVFLVSQGVNLYKNWYLKEELQNDIFALEKTKNQKIKLFKWPLKVSKKALSSFEKLMQLRANPLEDLNLLSALNTKQTQITGVVWERQKSGKNQFQKRLQIRVCKVDKTISDLEEWSQQHLHKLKKLSYQIGIREEDREADLEMSSFDSDDSVDSFDSSGSCLSLEIVKEEKR